jgi:malonate transporter and related proteins
VNFVELLLPNFALIWSGYLICRFTKLNRAVWSQIDAAVYYLFFPVLLFHAITKTHIDMAAASRLIAAGWLLAAATVALAMSAPRWPWLGARINRRDHAASAQVGFRFNSFIALGIVGQLLGDPGMLLLGVLIGVCVPVFNMAAVWSMARHGDTHLLTQLKRNPLVWATTLGLAFNLVGLDTPQWLQPTLSRIGQAGLVMGLMAAGAGMQLMDLKQAKALAVAMLAVRHLAAPLVAALLVLALDLPALEATVLLIFAAVPTASSCYVLAASMGYNGGLVAALVTLSTLAALASLPFSLGVLLPWVT